jgi:hypothetical protein
MSNNTKIFSEAIAEAKAIRETAMTNAKLALEEAFAPRMQEMMSNKLEALAEEDEMDENFTGKNGEMTSNDGDAMEEDYGQAETDAAEDEISLEELIAELDGLEETSGYEKDPEDRDTHLSNDGYGKVSTKDGVNDPYGKTLAEAEDEDAVGEITVDELKDIIRSVMNDVMETEEEEGEAEEEAEEEAEDAEELNLDEILAELDSLNEGEDLDESIDVIAQLIDTFPFLNNNTAQMLLGAFGAVGLTGIAAITAKIQSMALKGTFGEKGKAFAEKLQAAGGAAANARNVSEGEDEMEEGIGSAIKGAAQKVSRGLEKAYDAVSNAKPLPGVDRLEKSIDKGAAGLKKAGFLGTNMTKGQRAFEGEELEEAMNTIATLRSELNEVNLLNAKLLYVNKLFKSKNLTEAQKVKVINAFDRAETVKETKNIFETLKESLNTPVKGAIKESLSFASKAAGVADRKPIVENNDFVARMQKLAGII